MLVAWVDIRGKIQYMSNMTQHQKYLVKTARDKARETKINLQHDFDINNSSATSTSM